MTLDKDQVKEARNLKERGIPFDEAEQLDWSTAILWQDMRRNYGESRYCALGLIEGRLYNVVFTPRYGKPRIISLRKANTREVRRYEKETQP